MAGAARGGGASVNRYLKAITAALVAGLGSLQVAETDGQVTARELITVAIAGLAALGATWGVPNDTPDAPAAEPVALAKPKPTPHAHSRGASGRFESPRQQIN